MRYLLILLAVTMALAQDTTKVVNAPFGLQWGKPRPASIRCDTVHKEHGIEYCSTDNPPKASRHFEYYILVTINGKLAKVTAKGNPVSDDAYGTEITQIYENFKELLIEIYEEPTHVFEWVSATDPFRHPHLFWKCLDREGCLRKASAFRDGQIFLEVQSEPGHQRGFIQVTYEHPDYGLYLENLRKKLREDDKSNL